MENLNPEIIGFQKSKIGIQKLFETSFSIKLLNST
jgi:hypothetical protein